MNEYFQKAFDLSGRVALITGGGTGLGFATAKCLASAGAKVVITGRREEVLAAACEEIGESASYYVYDVTDHDDDTIRFISIHSPRVGRDGDGHQFLSRQQFVHRYTEELCDCFQRIQIGVSSGRFPF